MQSKIEDPHIQLQVIKLLDETSIPASIDFVSNNLNLGWGTARAILLALVIEGKISGQKTTKGWIFWPKTKKFKDSENNLEEEAK